ncbi:MAG: URC4/urg3 family protein [Moorea sp. SIO1G6]|uniref:URC4/urg3 family protein n=1 Tax=Moorena sp. SIO1G6 TaxID=2607840 RepID=UPI0013C00D9A|nr:URC4/urg3 family protein [Moorena sp. SIO1G6]NES85077.1 URC4/urg3 family protein [Moorena sp. SIO2B7]NET68246.1 URC4/urg3 family protein [Moorena sp. SIO1G6]
MSPLENAQQQLIAYLRTPLAIRERCDRIFTLASADQLQYFRCNLTKLEQVANYVIEVMHQHYPDFQIPFHSRWRHFEVGNVPRLRELDQKLAGFTPLQKAQTKFDLVIISVLLDAGAGSNWQYHEPETGLVFRRSEGLAVASFRMFCQGAFSSDPDLPWQVDAKGLQSLSAHHLAQGFQVSQTNPLIGIEGRLALLQRLGQSLAIIPQMFGKVNPRPGNLVNYLVNDLVNYQLLDKLQVTKGLQDSNLNLESCQDNQTWVKPLTDSQPAQEQPATCQPANLQPGNQQPATCEPANLLSATNLFSTVLEGLGDIWPRRESIAGVNLGDVWQHSALKGDNYGSEYVPFHKLSQWLTYSLLEPLQELGLEITELEQLTGLAEYRNGGLCLDLGLLEVKDSAILQQSHLPSSEVIIEWRALTVSLLDQIAGTIRQQLNLSATELPLVKVLQGGTWTAGRRIAAQLRPGGSSPIQIESDGTVF